MGRKKVTLAESTKHLTKEEKAIKEFEESLVKANKDKIKAPTWLKGQIALREFKRLVMELEVIDIITNLDINNIASYCEAYSNYVQATKELASQSLTVEKQLPNGGVNVVENPLIRIQKIYAEEMRRFGNLCGLSIDSRLKFATSKAKDIKDDIKDDFGDI